MKPTATAATVSLALLLSSCFTAREGRIESDYSYAGNFRHYRTFAFLQGADGSPRDSAAVLDETVRDAIQTHLRAQGYKLNQRRPDLLISYRVFDGAMRFTGYNQPDLMQWVRKEAVEDDETPTDERQGYDRVRYLLNDGTLLITLIDHKNGRAVWQGYASNVTARQGAQASIIMRRAVRSIFDRYRVLSEDYQNEPQMR
ncbi:DUF4136 domain-containing protein [Hymenobacter sp. 15J16-1T3B]|uniref:DUF4136 domain-containing protein n=1 Tax=Hymenobacter sp. 15J16-1T3B TaxID=2886941 RepID=UPI001D10EED3|nr:DUF4136 domain-containing protein [Hymenobacter sp. 15J16-1T3B]MCC3158824.1 DUF4136 domain-containing protein [Hymenobacter sp. 15J16-1T3B]